MIMGIWKTVVAAKMSCGKNAMRAKMRLRAGAAPRNENLYCYSLLIDTLHISYDMQIWIYYEPTDYQTYHACLMGWKRPFSNRNHVRSVIRTLPVAWGLVQLTSCHLSISVVDPSTNQHGLSIQSDRMVTPGHFNTNPCPCHFNLGARIYCGRLPHQPSENFIKWLNFIKTWMKRHSALLDYMDSGHHHLNGRHINLTNAIFG